MCLRGELIHQFEVMVSPVQGPKTPSFSNGVVQLGLFGLFGLLLSETSPSANVCARNQATKICWSREAPEGGSGRSRIAGRSRAHFQKGRFLCKAGVFMVLLEGWKSRQASKMVLFRTSRFGGCA